jgi:tryptophan synthase alpha chain
MNRISNIFNHNHKALIAYITAGYPSMEATVEAVPLLAELGCDLVELGIPFSDPLADGATIQQASFKALHNGTTPLKCLEAVSQIRQKSDIPLVFMSYYNPIYSFGLSKFSQVCAISKIDGLIVPDLPPDEGVELEKTAGEQGLDLIYLLAPTATGERMKLVTKHSAGFVYLVSIAGVTGTRNKLPVDLENFVRQVRSITRKPLCVGFGISTPEQAGEVARYADGVIVGSRLVQLMEGANWKIEIGNFIVSLRKALNAANG